MGDNRISVSRRCKNPIGKNNQLKNIGCKTAVCMKGEGGQNVWQECKQPATEEKQTIIIEHLEKMIGLLELLLPDSTTASTTSTTTDSIVNGGWGSWGSWSACSRTCGSGTQSRTRSCDSPAPANGGDQCPGTNITTTTCNTQCCAVDGIWSSWSSWSNCSTVCGGGTSSRTRSCIGQTCGGKPCPGNNNDSKSCNEECCPVDGVWASWSIWSDCSKDCGGGTTRRTRSCNG